MTYEIKVAYRNPKAENISQRGKFWEVYYNGGYIKAFQNRDEASAYISELKAA